MSYHQHRRKRLSRHLPPLRRTGAVSDDHDTSSRPHNPRKGVANSDWRRQNNSIIYQYINSWRRGQSRANPSPVGFPVKQGKYRNFSRVMADSSPITTHNGLTLLALWARYPAKQTRNQFVETGTFLSRSGNSPPDQGNPFQLRGRFKSRAGFGLCGIFSIMGLSIRHRPVGVSNPGPVISEGAELSCWTTLKGHAETLNDR